MAGYLDNQLQGQVISDLDDLAALPGIIAVRDSKDPAGPALTFTPTAWRSFLARVADRP